MLFAGLVVLSVGGAGLLTGLFRGAGASVETARTAGFVIAALAPPAVLFFATRSVTNGPRSRRVAGGGATFAGVSAIVSGLVGGMAGIATGSPLSILLAVGYGSGTLLAFGGLLAGVSTRDPARRPSRRGVSWQASQDSRRSRSAPGAAPADGGSTDSDLDFPLDSEDEENGGERD